MKKNKGGGGKKKRMITMDIKHEIIEKHELGARVSDLARDYDRTTSTICTILKQKEAIKKLKPSKGLTIMHPSRTDVHVEMEKLLLMWIKEKHLAGDTITEGIVCDKAFEIYTNLKATSGEEQASTSTGKTTIPFKASHGWFEKFKKRTGTHLIFRRGETGSSDAAAATEFVEHFGRLIAREGYVAEQVFNYDETGFFWKKMPRRTFIRAEEIQLPELRDRLTLTFCANASGDLKIKPLVVYHSDNPSAFKTHKVDKTKLQVMWRATAKAWVTRQIFIEWFNEIFGPSVKKYLTEKKLPLKCLLVLDNAPGHVPELGEEILNEFNFINIIHLPPNISPLLHPLDHHVISNFKKLYIKYFLKKCVDVINTTNLTVLEFWKDHFDIVTSLRIIDEAWQGVTKKILNLTWRKIWPEIVAERDIEEIVSQEEIVLNEIVSLGKSMNLEINEEDINDLIVEHSVELTAEELLHVELSEERKKEEEVEPGRNISSKEIKKMLKSWEEVCDFIDRYHPDKLSCSRARVFYNETCVQFFRNILNRRQIHSS